MTSHEAIEKLKKYSYFPKGTEFLVEASSNDITVKTKGDYILVFPAALRHYYIVSTIGVYEGTTNIILKKWE